MDSLLVAHTAPWPADTGGKLRLDLVTRGLARRGNVDVFAFGWTDDLPYPRDRVRRFAVAPRARPRVSGVTGRLRWLAASARPMELSFLDAADLRAAFAGFVADRVYDVIWFAHPKTFEPLGDLATGPVILDCDDLENYKHLGRRETIDGRTYGPRRLLRRNLASINARRWTTWYSSLESRVQRAVVCSDLDRQRIGIRNAAVIPNGYRRPAPLIRDPARRRSPTVTFPGTMTYAPNIDAAHFFVENVLPELRRLVPDVACRLVGGCDHRVQRLHDPPGVVVTGWVERMSDELAETDLVVVPLRFGSGTRLKILEAFAYGVPVVSTNLGAEGLNVVDGVHALLADGPREFAASCAALLQDRERARALIGRAQEFFLEHYDATTVEGQVGDLAASVAGAHA